MINTLSKAVLACFLLALVVGGVLGGLVSLIHQNAGLFLGIFVGGMAFTHFLDSIYLYSDEE